MCEKLFKNSSAVKLKPCGSTPSLAKDQRALTVLFDYESKNFSLRKGEVVKVLRDYDSEYFLVAKTEKNAAIGFVPKDFTIDFVELEKRVQKNLWANEKSDPKTMATTSLCKISQI